MGRERPQSDVPGDIPAIQPEAIAGFHVETVGDRGRKVELRRDGLRYDGGCQMEVAARWIGDDRRTRRSGTLDAKIHALLGAEVADLTLQGYAVIVHRSAEARQPVRLIHHTEFSGLRFFRFQGGVAPGDVLDLEGDYRIQESVLDGASGDGLGCEQFAEVGGA